MSLKNLFQAIESDLPRYARAFERVRDCTPALATYETPADLARVLSDRRVSARTRNGLTVVAATEARKPGASPVWSSILTIALAPMLHEIRRRVGGAEDDDLDSLVMVAFLNALQIVPVGTFLLIALRRETTTQVIRRCARDRRLDVSTEFDDEIHGVDLFGRDEEAAKRDALAQLEARFGSQIFDVLRATRGTGVSLKEYVEKTCPDRRQHARRYEQLRVARLRLERAIRDRLKAHAA